MESFHVFFQPFVLHFKHIKLLQKRPKTLVSEQRNLEVNFSS